LAKNEGKKFEEDFKKSVPDDIYYYRLRDSGSAFGGGSEHLRFTISNKYDCYIYKKPNFYPIELKSTKSTSMSIQHDKEEKGKMIKLNQIDGLTEASEHDGIHAGFLFNFRSNKNNTYWLNIKDFNKFNDNTDKKSINEKDVIEHNGIFIKSEIKRVRYKYYINEFIENF